MNEETENNSQNQEPASQAVPMSFQGTTEAPTQSVNPDENAAQFLDQDVPQPEKSAFEEESQPNEQPNQEATEKRTFAPDRVDLKELHRMRQLRNKTTNPIDAATTHPAPVASQPTTSIPQPKPQAEPIGVKNPIAGAPPSTPLVEETKEEAKEPQPKSPKSATSAEDTYAMFECNICLETAKEPVVSKCGHLYCWPCIYTWMNQPRETMVCPVCKSGISADSVIPIYTKENSEDPRKKNAPQGNIPGRPQGERQEAQANPNMRRQGLFGGNGSGFVMGFGIFPTLFSLNFTWDDIAGTNNLDGNQRRNGEENREQQIQRFFMIFAMFLLFSFFSFGSDVFLTF